MSKVVFTDDTFIILAAIPIASVWPLRQNLFAAAEASEVLAGKSRRLRCVNHERGNTTLLMPAVRSDVERRE